MKKARKKARAAPPPKANKDDTVRFRVSADQKAAFEEAAARDGLDLSQWLRQLAMRASGMLGGGPDK